MEDITVLLDRERDDTPPPFPYPGTPEEQEMGAKALAEALQEPHDDR